MTEGQYYVKHHKKTGDVSVGFLDDRTDRMNDYDWQERISINEIIKLGIERHNE